MFAALGSRGIAMSVLGARLLAAWVTGAACSATGGDASSGRGAPQPTARDRDKRHDARIFFNMIASPFCTGVHRRDTPICRASHKYLRVYQPLLLTAIQTQRSARQG